MTNSSIDHSCSTAARFLTIGGSCLNVSVFMCPSPLVSRVTFSLQVEVGFKSTAFEPHPRSNRNDDSLLMLAILSVHTSSCWIIPSTAIAVRQGPFAWLPSLLLQGSRRAPQCRNKTSVPARACRLSGGKAPRLLLRSGLLPDSRLFASKARQLRHRRRRLRADPSSVVPQWVAKESTCRPNVVLREWVLGFVRHKGETAASRTPHPAGKARTRAARRDVPRHERFRVSFGGLPFWCS